jgi:uncharacterized protein
MNFSDKRPWWVEFAFLYAGLGLFFGYYATIYFRRYPVSVVQSAAIYICLMMLFGLCLAPAFPELRFRLREHVHGRQGAAYCILLFLVPYLLYCLGTGSLHWPALTKVFGLAALPFGLFAVAPVRKSGRLNWQDVVVLLWLLSSVLFGQIAGIWNVPANLDFMARLFLLGVGSWSFLIMRRIEGTGYDFHHEFRFSASVGVLLVSFTGFAAIAIPLGFGLGFIAWNPQWRGAPALLFDFATIFLFVALLEELFFRGLLQNLLTGSLRSKYVAQGVTAVVFGLSHIRHAPFPNWRYVILATVAGWFYGSAYRNSGSLIVSSTVHALVDTLWRTWFTLPRP